MGSILSLCITVQWWEEGLTGTESGTDGVGGLRPALSSFPFYVTYWRHLENCVLSGLHHFITFDVD